MSHCRFTAIKRTVSTQTAFFTTYTLSLSWWATCTALKEIHICNQFILVVQSATIPNVPAIKLHLFSQKYKSMHKYMYVYWLTLLFIMSTRSEQQNIKHIPGVTVKQSEVK